MGSVDLGFPAMERINETVNETTEAIYLQNDQP
jgi:hypothetical protein